jgi:hypothetical protein
MSNQPPTFPGSRVPVTNQVAGALESLSAYVAAGGNPAQWVRENIRTDVSQKENTK